MIERIEMTRKGEAYRTACRLAEMAKEETPVFVPWGHVFETPDGDFRITNDLKGPRGNPMRNFLEHGPRGAFQAA